MTREEAIKKFKDLIFGGIEYDDCCTRDVYSSEKEAFEMAIQALEQNESAEKWYKLFVEKLDELEPCDDAISRADAIEALTGWETEATDEEIEYTLNKLPSVTPKQKSGHWEWVQYDSSPNIGNWRCSECRAIIPHTPKEIDNTPIYKLCPMCGAKMVEPQERSDK